MLLRFIPKCAAAVALNSITLGKVKESNYNGELRLPLRFAAPAVNFSHCEPNKSWILRDWLLGTESDRQYKAIAKFFSPDSAHYNPATGAVWLMELASKGHQDSQYVLGNLYAAGKGVPVDMVQAVRYFKLAADAGHANAQCKLADCYAKGDGVDKNEEMAAKYFSMSAKQGIPLAQYELGVCYDDGLGVPVDPVQAVSYYELAAAQGCIHSQYELGDHYRTGSGVTKCYKRALQHYQHVAEKGNGDAQIKLVCLHIALAGDDQQQRKHHIQSAMKYFQMLKYKDTMFASLPSLYHIIETGALHEASFADLKIQYDLVDITLSIMLVMVLDQGIPETTLARVIDLLGMPQECLAGMILFEMSYFEHEWPMKGRNGLSPDEIKLLREKMLSICPYYLGSTFLVWLARLVYRMNTPAKPRGSAAEEH